MSKLDRVATHIPKDVLKELVVKLFVEIGGLINKGFKRSNKKIS